MRISLTEELSALEYSRRLCDFARNVMVDGEGSVGQTLYVSGAQALGRGKGEIAVGQLVDLVAIDSNDTALCALPTHQILDGIDFAATDRIVTDVWSAGRQMAKNGRNISRDQIVAIYRSTMRCVMSLL